MGSAREPVDPSQQKVQGQMVPSGQGSQLLLGIDRPTRHLIADPRQELIETERRRWVYERRPRVISERIAMTTIPTSTHATTRAHTSEPAMKARVTR